MRSFFGVAPCDYACDFLCDFTPYGIYDLRLIEAPASKGENQAKGGNMKRYKFVCTLDFSDVIAQTLIWIVLVICTFGLALPFFAYFFIRLIINKTEMHEISVGGVGAEPYIRSEPGN